MLKAKLPSHKPSIKNTLQGDDIISIFQRILKLDIGPKYVGSNLCTYSFFQKSKESEMEDENSDKNSILLIFNDLGKYCCSFFTLIRT